MAVGMNFQGMRSSDYSRAGKAVADDMVRSHAAARRNAPKYGKIIQAADNFRAGTKQAAIAAQAQVTRTGIDAAGRLEAHNIKLDAREGLRKARRKAGVLAAGGKLLAGAGDAFKEAPKYESTSLDYSEQIAKLRNKASSYYGQVGKGNYDLSTDTSNFDLSTDTSNMNLSTDSPTKPDSPASPKGSSGKLISSGQALKAGKGTAGKGGKYTQSQMTQFAMDAGFSPEKARIMGAIGMGESGGNAGVDTSMTIDPNKTNEYSIGLFQINAQAHGDKLARLGYTEDDLRDPVKNAKVAKLVHDEVGGFGPWSVYSKGIYKDYL